MPPSLSFINYLIFYGRARLLSAGKTIEGARTELVEVIEGWIALRLRLGLPIPMMDNQAIEASAEPIAGV